MRLDAVASARVRVPATCGELLQGFDDSGPVLVSLPIDVWGSVEVTLVRDAVFCVEPELPRARRALELALDRCGWRGGAVVRLGGEIPHARGMGSSTADVAGVLGGVCRAAGVALGAPELVKLMTAVEPSDSSPLAGLWAIDHVGGRRAHRLGELPADWWVVYADSGVGIDTLSMHRGYGAGPAMPPGIVQATRWDDPYAVAAVATQSALRNQERLANPHFAVVRDVAGRVRAPGVCVAHSGTVCGVICDGVLQAAAARRLLRIAGLQVECVRAQAPGMVVQVRAADGRTAPSAPVAQREAS